MRIRKITQNTRDFNITDAVTDGGTDLNKDTFNGLQDNIENAINKKNYISLSLADHQILTQGETYERLNLGKVLYKKGTKLSQVDGRVVIGVGVTDVDISAKVYLRTGYTAGTSVRGAIFKNNSAVADIRIGTNFTGGESISISSITIPVEEGDVISLQVQGKNNMGIGAFDSLTHLNVREI